MLEQLKKLKKKITNTVYILVYVQEFILQNLQIIKIYIFITVLLNIYAQSLCI